jgi:nucleotide-binding universal stress UspA family protein
MTFSRILCPIDLSPLSPCLVRHAMAQAEGPGARVQVLHAVEPLLLQAATIAGASATLRGEIDAELRRVIRDLAPAADGAPRFDTSIAERAADVAILEASSRDRTDLIVMGMHGMSALSKACFGSTLERVLRGTTVPVLALPTTGLSQGGDCLPHPTARVIAAIDFQEPSMQAARFAADYALGQGADLTLLHVMPAIPAWGGHREAVDKQHLLRYQRAENELAVLARELSRGRRLPKVEVREGTAWEEIAASGGERLDSLVVMGLARPGRHFARPGSVAWRVLSIGAHPVLVAPPTPARSGRSDTHAGRETYTETR